MPSIHSLGKQGEDIACEFLVRNHFTILERNWRYGHCEIDIITRLAESLIVFEVKTRRVFREDPAYAVSNKQLRRVSKATAFYLEKNSLDLEYRIDLLAIEENYSWRKILHREEIF